MSFIVPTNFRQLPPVWETAQPFNINATGAVAYDVDPVSWARNHILAVLLTNPGERVMRPNYGVGIHGFVWENQDPLTEQQMLTTIQQAVNTWEPNITLHELRFVPQPEFSGIMDLEISFSVGAIPTIHVISFSLGGTGVEIMS
jgi:Bacteriophage baseplate protein W